MSDSVVHPLSPAWNFQNEHHRPGVKQQLKLRCFFLFLKPHLRCFYLHSSVVRINCHPTTCTTKTNAVNRVYFQIPDKHHLSCFVTTKTQKLSVDSVFCEFPITPLAKGTMSVWFQASLLRLSKRCKYGWVLKSQFLRVAIWKSQFCVSKDALFWVWISIYVSKRGDRVCNCGKRCGCLSSKIAISRGQRGVGLLFWAWSQSACVEWLIIVSMYWFVIWFLWWNWFHPAT